MNPWKKRAFEFNRKRAEADEKAADMQKIAEKLSQLPPGQLKKILDDEMIEILRKYGVETE